MSVRRKMTVRLYPFVMLLAIFCCWSATLGGLRDVCLLTKSVNRSGYWSVGLVAGEGIPVGMMILVSHEQHYCEDRILVSHGQFAE